VSGKYEKALADDLAASVRLLALVIEGNASADVDEKGLLKFAQRAASASSGQEELEACREVLLDKGTHFSVRAAVISYVGGWFSKESPTFRSEYADTPRAVDEATACVTLGLQDDNGFVRKLAEDTVERLKQGDVSSQPP
jgi:hypothetical protein